MTIEAYADTFAGYRVEEYCPETLTRVGRPGVIHRLTLGYERASEGQTFGTLFDQFLANPAGAEAPGLVIGAWGDEGEAGSAQAVIEALAAARDRLPNLRALFLGDIVREECEISWILQGDVSPLLDAYPALEHLRVRGGNGLSLGTPRHDRLRSLVIESGGLEAEVLAEIAAAELPQLEHLELWLGSANYGGIDTADPLAPLLDGILFPRLRYLGLRDSEIADAVAQAVAASPVLEVIRVLDLSLGNLGDDGARALLASPAVRRLEKLDIHHHYVSDAVVKQLQRLGIEVDAGEPREPDCFGDGEEFRYIAVSE